MKVKKSFLFIVLCFTTFSCTKDREFLQKAESSPDSVSFYLQQINHPDRFNIHEKGIYNYLLYGGIVTTRGIGPDSLLEICDACFIESGDTSRWRSVQVSKAINMLQQQQYDKLLLFADSLLALKRTDDSLCYNLYKNKASVFDRLDKPDEQLSCYDKSLGIALRVKDSNWIEECIQLKINVLAMVGRSLDAIELSKQLDKIILNYQRGYLNPMDENRLFCESLYLEVGDTIGAIQFMDSIKRYRRGKYDIPYEYLARGDIWLAIHRPDSARYYFRQAAEASSPYVSEVAYQRMYELINMYESPGEVYYLKRKQQYMLNCIATNYKSDEDHKDFRQLQLTNELNVLHLKQKTTEVVILFVLLLILSIVFIVFFFYQRERRRRLMEKTRYLNKLQDLEAERIQQEHRTLLNEKELAQLRATEMEHAKIAGELREMLLRNIPLILKISQQHDDSDQEQMKIEVSDREWSQIILSVNKGFDNFTGRLKAEYPNLSESDIRFCCLVKIHVNVEDLSNIYCVTPAAIIKRKYRIKKDRFGVTDESKSLDHVLHEF